MNSNSFGFHTNMLPSLINKCIIITIAIAVITYQTFDDPMQKDRKTTIKSLDVSANRLRC